MSNVWSDFESLLCEFDSAGLALLTASERQEFRCLANTMPASSRRLDLEAWGTVPLWVRRHLLQKLKEAQRQGIEALDLDELGLPRDVTQHLRETYRLGYWPGPPEEKPEPNTPLPIVATAPPTTETKVEEAVAQQQPAESREHDALAEQPKPEDRSKLEPSVFDLPERCWRPFRWGGGTTTDYNFQARQQTAHFSLIIKVYRPMPGLNVVQMTWYSPSCRHSKMILALGKPPPSSS